ncbi:MAG: hypothetical protein K8S99_12685 [Planctomycetes bacterium]|nr:hypothetical protein [Planctomycetota bacterium]
MQTALITLACSGPGVANMIQMSNTIGYFCAAIGGVVTLALAYDMMRTHRWRLTLLIATALLLVHPAWTIPANHGDCGALKCQTATLFTALYFCLLGYQYWASKQARKAPG